MFDGEDPAGWIARAEVYFQVQGTSPEVKVNLAQLCMEEPTIHFFKSICEENNELTWEIFKSELLERYGGIGERDIYEQLSSLRQVGSVDEYIREFERLTAQIRRLPEEQYFGYFIHGLKEKIRGRVRSMRALGPLSRSRLMNLTRAIEYELQETKGSWNGSRSLGGRNGFGSGRSSPNSPMSPNNSARSSGSEWVYVRGNREAHEGSGTKQVSVQEKGRANHRDKGIRHLPYHELMDRKQKGLCYKCGGSFHPLHQCPDRQLIIMVLADDGEEEEEAKVLAIEVDDVVETEGECSVMHLGSLITDKEWKPQTMKLKGLAKGVPILVLIDSGATNNFISKKLVAAMGWPIEETRPMRIKLGDGYKVIAQGKCADVELSLGDINITVHTLLFELEGIDVVLGISWLASLGGMWVDWKTRSMKFQWNNK